MRNSLQDVLMAHEKGMVAIRIVDFQALLQIVHVVSIKVSEKVYINLIILIARYLTEWTTRPTYGTCIQRNKRISSKRLRKLEGVLLLLDGGKVFEVIRMALPFGHIKTIYNTLNFETVQANNRP